MKFGVFSVSDHYPQLPRTERQHYEELIEYVQVAEGLGASSFWVAEHHFHEYGIVPNPAVILGAMSRVTKRIRLGPAVSVLTFHNPLLVAEEYAMVDLLTDGRLNFGAGSGYLRHEFEHFRVSLDEKRERAEEALRVVLQAWMGEPVYFSGRYFQVDGAKLNITPVQKPHPPVYFATLRPEGAYEIGRKGYSLLMIPYATVDNLEGLRPLIEQYRQGLQEGGFDTSSREVAITFHTHVAESFEEACRNAQAALELYVKTRLYAKQRFLDYLYANDIVLWGDPDHVASIVKRVFDMGATEIVLLMDFGALEQRLVYKSLENFVRYVWPAVSGSLASV
jgi:alkanesulfonate monooxygenase SsuD/methylene tetrahydromethanopterin reductase-like flavin-dependent oxidoreductase (luciferase family)